jgi:hypothetical protein
LTHAAEPVSWYGHIHLARERSEHGRDEAGRVQATGTDYPLRRGEEYVKALGEFGFSDGDLRKIDRENALALAAAASAARPTATSNVTNGKRDSGRRERVPSLR